MAASSDRKMNSGVASEGIARRLDLAELSRKLDDVASDLSTWIRRNGPSDEPASGTTDWSEIDSGATARNVRKLIRQRRLRGRYFPPDLFADPAWDILLDLTAARLEGSSVPISSVCIAAGVPTTTALRWVATLVDLGLLTRRSDTSDRRRVFVELTEAGWDAMSRFFTNQAPTAGTD